MQIDIELTEDELDDVLFAVRMSAWEYGEMARRQPEAWEFRRMADRYLALHDLLRAKVVGG